MIDTPLYGDRNLQTSEESVFFCKFFCSPFCGTNKKLFGSLRYVHSTHFMQLFVFPTVIMEIALG